MNPDRLEEIVRGLRRARGVVKGEGESTGISFSEIEAYLTPKPIVSGIMEGDIVELVAGPFKGEKARVMKIDETKEEITVELFEAMVRIPVTLLVDPKTKTFSIEVGTPPTSALITKELKIEKGSGDPGKTRVGNLSLPQAIRIANMKTDTMLAKTLKARVLEVVGTCVSMGVTVVGKLAKDLSKDIQAGKFDKQLAG